MQPSSKTSTMDTIALNTAVDSLDPTNMETTTNIETSTSSTEQTNTNANTDTNLDRNLNKDIVIPLSDLTEEELATEYSLKYYKEHRTWKKCLKEFACDLIEITVKVVLLVAVFAGVLCMVIFL